MYLITSAESRRLKLMLEFHSQQNILIKFTRPVKLQLKGPLCLFTEYNIQNFRRLCSMLTRAHSNRTSRQNSAYCLRTPHNPSLLITSSSCKVILIWTNVFDELADGTDSAEQMKNRGRPDGITMEDVSPAVN